MGFDMGADAIPQIAFDESGNTGADLMNDEQPVFALASTSLSLEEVTPLLAPLKGRQAAEVKFARLKRSASGQQRLTSALASSQLNAENVVRTLVHKRFMVVAKMVDLLIEPQLHRAGHDAYKSGFNLSYANVLFICLPTFLGEAVCGDLLSRFVALFRERSPDAKRKFYALAREVVDQRTDRFAEIFAPILGSEPLIDDILQHNDRLSLDPAIPTFFQHCALWGNRLGRRFQLVHDESKPIFQDKEALESLMSPSDEGRWIGYDRRSFIFPLRAESIVFGRSEEDARLQLADLVASSGAHWAAAVVARGARAEFWKGLSAAGIERFVADGLWPTAAVTPEELGTVHTGGVEPIEHMTNFLSRRR